MNLLIIICINQFHVIVFMCVLYCIVLVVWDYRVLFQQEKIWYNFLNFERKMKVKELKICKHLFKHSNKISFCWYSYLLSSLSLSLSGKDFRKFLKSFDKEDRTDQSKLYKKESFKLKPIYPDEVVDDDYKTKVIEIEGFKWYSTFLIFYFM